MAAYQGHYGYNQVSVDSPETSHLQASRLAHQQSYTSFAGTLRSRSPSPYRDHAAQSGERLLQNQASEAAATTALGSTAPANLHLRKQVVVTDNPISATDISLYRFSPLQSSDLKFRPLILKTRILSILVALYVAAAAAVAVVYWRAGPDNQYNLSSENVLLISRYFPSLFGTFTMILFRHTVREFLRMTPYINMADQDGRLGAGKPWKSVGGAFFPWQNVTITPGLTSVLSFMCLSIATFVVSLKVALLASSLENNIWVLRPRFYPALALIIIYMLMAIYTALLAWTLRNKSTGLRWDPTSIADFVALFAQCNALDFFSQLELRHETRPRKAMSRRHRFRLGYWNKRLKEAKDDDIGERVYGIGVDYHGLDTEEGSTANSPPKKRRWQRSKPDPAPMHDHSKDECAYGKWPHCEHYPYRRNPGVSRIRIVLFTLFTWGVLGLSLYALAGPGHFVLKKHQIENRWSIPSQMPSVTFGNHTVTAPPIDPLDPKSTVLVYALLMRSLPTYIAGLYVDLIVEAIDLNMRFMQPFRNMFEHAGEAADTILLAYITLSPLQVPVTALAKGHYKVMFYSTINTFSPLFPIFVGGLVALQPEDKVIHYNFSLSACIGTLVFLIIFTIAIPLAWPFSRRLLPRQFYSMADLMAMCYDARFIANPAFNISDKERTPDKPYFEARILLSGEKFLFGRYRGRDDEWHLGFDCRFFRGADYGTLQENPDVVWMRPESKINRLKWFKKEDQQTTAHTPNGNGQLRSDCELKQLASKDQVRVEHHERESAHDYGSGNEVPMMHGALYYEQPAGTLATGMSGEAPGLGVRYERDADQRSRMPYVIMDRYD